MHSTPKETTTTTYVVLVACGSFNPITYAHLRMMELARDAIERPQTNPNDGLTSLDTPNTKIVLGGYLSPVASAYHKKDLAPASTRIHMTTEALASSPWLMCDPWEGTRESYTRTYHVLDHIYQNVAQWLQGELSPHTRDKTLEKETKSPNKRDTKKESENKASPLGSYALEVHLVIGADVFRSMALCDGASGRPVWRLDTLRPLLQHYPLVVIDRCTEADYVGEEKTRKSAVLPSPEDKHKKEHTVSSNKNLTELDCKQQQEHPSFTDVLNCVLKDDNGCEVNFAEYTRTTVVVCAAGERNDVSSSHVRSLLREGRSVRYLIPETVMEYVLRAGLYRA